MIEHYKNDHHLDIGYVNKEKPPYRKIKGYTHIWTYFTTSNGNFICSQYRKERGALITSITNTPTGWNVHLFYGGSKFKSWFFTFDLLSDALEQCELFLNDQIIMKDNKILLSL